MFLKSLAVIFNVLALLTIILIINDTGVPSPKEEGFWYILVFSATPIVNLIYIFFTKSDTWLSLYFKRKSAEERKRIRDLESNSQG